MAARRTEIGNSEIAARTDTGNITFGQFLPGFLGFLKIMPGVIKAVKAMKNFRNILIDKTSADLLKGSEIDYVSELMGESFKISNPQTKSSCGCGVSFSL